MFSPRGALSSLNDSRSVVHGTVSTALLAGLTLIEPRRLGTGGRLAYRAATAVLSAWGVWAMLRTEHSLPTASKVGLTIGAGGAVLGVAGAGESLDARLTDRLARAGASRPRVILAAAAATLSLGSWWLGRTPIADPLSDAEGEYVEEIVDVPDDVRALTARLLAATDAFGAPELRAQLAEARASVYEGEDADAFWPGIGFQVPAHLPRAVPGDATFPVIGRYRALDGLTFDLYLVLESGRLGTLAVSEAREWTPDEHEAWMDAGRGVHELGAWPTVDELELLIETPEGFQPPE